MQSYTTRDNMGRMSQGTFLVSHKTDPPIHFLTGAEPKPVQDLRVSNNSCTSIELCWKKPDTFGYHLLGGYKRIVIVKKYNNTRSFFDRQLTIQECLNKLQSPEALQKNF